MQEQNKVGYILGVTRVGSILPGWIGSAIEVVEPNKASASFLWTAVLDLENARIFGASENVGGLIFFLAAQGYRVTVERVGELA